MMNLTQSLRQACQVAGDKTATLFLHRRRTWAELYNRVARLAGGLCANGVEPGSRVAVLSLNSDRYLETYYALWWSGAAIVPLNTRWNIRENIYALTDSEPAMLFVDEHFVDQLPQLLLASPSINTVIFMGEGDTPDDALDYENLIDTHAAAKDVLCQGDDLAGIFYTGGTTGSPKGVMLSHGSMYISALGGIASGLTRMDDYVYLHQAPMFHLADVAMITCGTMLRVTHAIISQFTPNASLDAIEQYRVTHSMFVPAMLSMFLHHPRSHEKDLSSLKRISYGASPMPDVLLREALQRLPEVDLIQGYGQTELSPLATALLPEDHVLTGPGSARLRSAGRAAPHCEVEVVDENLNPVANNTVGQVRVRGANIMLGYWKLPKLTAETIVEGWVLTGDAGYMDDDGYLFLVDRIKDMIVSGGENVYSVEVENVIMLHSAVDQCAVIGIPHDKWVESVHAIIVVKPGHSVNEQEIIDHCHEYIAGYKCPRSVDLRSEPLPLSGAGKVLKRELRPNTEV